MNAKQTHYQSADGLKLSADAFGDPGGTPVLLLHGGGQTRHAWAGTGSALADAGYYAVSLDLRGHGNSDWCPRGQYAHADFAADTACVAAQFDQPPVLAGASLGGMSSLFALGEAAEQGRPVPARALVLVDIATRMQVDGAQRIMDFMKAHPEGFASLEEAAEAVAGYNPHRPRPKDPRGLAKNLRLGEDGRYRWHWDPAFLEDRLAPSSSTNILEKLDQAAKSLSIPTLLVRGRMSDLLSEEDARHFLGLVPHAEFVDVSGAGHMVAGDRNDHFSQGMMDFLKQHVPPESSQP
ncbi:alpha/beta hydrolase [Myxococcota bacterium]|nr:alpha/beta hydrolase [Myxococcota bacterium]